MLLLLGAFIFVLTGCVTSTTQTLNYPTGLSIPQNWENGVTFYTPKPLLKGKILALPESYENPMTSVKNQGQCGSCSHFASIGIYESALLRKFKIYADLSEQNVLNCAKYENYKCQGSYFHGRHLVENGAPFETAEPYAGRATQCRQMASAHQKPESWAFVGGSGRAPSELEVREALVNKGALWVTVYASSVWNSPGPIIRKAGGGNGRTNHAVILTGYKPDPQRPGQYLYHIKNSWGQPWNGDGYVWLEWGASMFGEMAAFLSMPGGNDPDNGGDTCVPALLNLPSTMAVAHGKEISFAVKPQEGFSYEWYDGINSIGKGAQIFYVPKADGTIKIVATNGCGKSEMTVKLQMVSSLF